MKKLILIALVVSGCSSVPKAKEQVQTNLHVKGSTNLGVIGIDKDGEVLVQEEVDAEIALRDVRWRVYDLERKIASDREYLERCRVEMADPRLGGSGQVTEIPEIDAQNVSQTTESFGQNEQQALVLVKKEKFTDRLVRERKYESSLSALSKTVEKHLKTCEREYGYVRVKHGLPAQRFTGQGFYEAGGKYVQTRESEKSLDDAFRLAGIKPMVAPEPAATPTVAVAEKKE